MTARQVFEATLIELSKVQAPALKLYEFNYLFNKAINQYINKVYNVYDINQQTTDDLRVLKSTAYLTPKKWNDSNSALHNSISQASSYLSRAHRSIQSMHGATYEVAMPIDYLHLLNCVCIYYVAKQKDCWDAGSYIEIPATRLTADSWSQIVTDIYNRPSPMKPYYYIHNQNNQTNNELLPTDPIIGISETGLPNGTDMTGTYQVTSNGIAVTVAKYEDGSQRYFANINGGLCAIAGLVLNANGGLTYSTEDTAIAVETALNAYTAAKTAEVTALQNYVKTPGTETLGTYTQAKTATSIAAATYNATVQAASAAGSAAAVVISDLECTDAGCLGAESVQTLMFYPNPSETLGWADGNIDKEAETLARTQMNCDYQLYLAAPTEERLTAYEASRSAYLASQASYELQNQNLSSTELSIGKASSNFPRTFKFDMNGDGIPDTNVSLVEKPTAIRTGNVSNVRMEIRYGKDDSLFQLKEVQVDYVKSPQFIRLTQEQIDLTEDTSQIMEFPDYVNQEIINELVHLVMERVNDPRLSNNMSITNTIARQGAQQQQPAQAQAQG